MNLKNIYGFLKPKKMVLWFNKSLLPEHKCDLLEYKESLINVNGALQEFKNGVIQLDENFKENITKMFHKKFMYEVRRARQEQLQTSIYKITNDSDINLFYDIYINFSKSKKISYYSSSDLKSLMKCGVLYYSISHLDHTILIYHLYFAIPNEEVILLASFSSIGTKSTLDPKYLGWANRLLHHDDIFYFIENNFKIYNLGGMGNPVTSNNENIVKFKMEMKPSILGYYNGIVPGSRYGKIYLAIKKIYKKIF